MYVFRKKPFLLYSDFFMFVLLHLKEVTNTLCGFCNYVTWKKKRYTRESNNDKIFIYISINFFLCVVTLTEATGRFPYKALLR